MYSCQFRSFHSLWRSREVFYIVHECLINTLFFIIVCFVVQELSLRFLFHFTVFLLWLHGNWSSPCSPSDSSEAILLSRTAGLALASPQDCLLTTNSGNSSQTVHSQDQLLFVDLFPRSIAGTSHRCVFFSQFILAMLTFTLYLSSSHLSRAS